MVLQPIIGGGAAARRIVFVVARTAGGAARGALVRFAGARAKRRRTRVELREIPHWMRKDIGLPEHYGQSDGPNWWDPPRN